MEKLVKEYFDSRLIQIPDDGLYMAVSAVYITIVRYQNHSAPETDKVELAGKELAVFFEYLKAQGIRLESGDIRILGGLLHGFKMISDISPGAGSAA